MQSGSGTGDRDRGGLWREQLRTGKSRGLWVGHNGSRLWLSFWVALRCGTHSSDYIPVLLHVFYTGLHVSAQYVTNLYEWQTISELYSK